jgi:cysteine desulfurase
MNLPIEKAISASRTYLDHNATTPVRPQVIEAMMAVCAAVGNPSSVHSEGRAARGLIEHARGDVAALVNARSADVFFTSGATEALNLALTPALQTVRASVPVERLLLSATEHPAVLRGHRFAPESVTLVPVTADGILDLDALDHLLKAAGGHRVMVAVQLANNETGVIQPIADIAAVVHAHDGVLVCDAAQAVGKIPVDVKRLGADVLIISGHKCGGPAGVGALVRGNRAVHIPEPVLKGGGQERGWRAGTENVPAIVGLGVACAAVCAHITQEAAFMLKLRGLLERGLKAHEPEIVIYGDRSPRLPTTLAFSVPNLTAETALMLLDLEGIAVSSGSACSSGKVKASHVLTAMGVAPDFVGNMLRLSVGWSTAQEDIDRFLEVWRKLRPQPEINEEVREGDEESLSLLN